MKAKKTYKGKADILNTSTFYRLPQVPIPTETYGRCRGTKIKTGKEFCKSRGVDTVLGNGYCTICWDKLIGSVESQHKSAIPV